MKTAHTAMGGFRSKYVYEDKEVKTNDIYIISEKDVPRKDTPSLYGQPLKVANKQE